MEIDVILFFELGFGTPDELVHVRNECFGELGSVIIIEGVVVTEWKSRGTEEEERASE